MAEKVPETARQFRARLQREGLWGKYEAEVERLERSGLDGSKAVEQARTLFRRPEDIPAPPPQQYLGEIPLLPREGVSKAPIGGNVKVEASASSAVVIEWIFNNMDKLTITESEAPSSGAYAWLKSCQNDSDVKKAFYSGAYGKLMMSKDSLEQQTARGRADEELLKLVEVKIGELSRDAKERAKEAHLIVEA